MFGFKSCVLMITNNTKVKQYTKDSVMYKHLHHPWHTDRRMDFIEPAKETVTFQQHNHTVEYGQQEKGKTE